MDVPRVVILGAGFGGLAVARSLAGVKAAVTVIDRNNHHLFQPLLYQVATAGLSATDIAVPIRSVLRHAGNTEVLMAEVNAVDPVTQEVSCAGGRRVPFDFLVVATGAVSSYFGKPEWEEHAPSLKSLADALRIRERVLEAFEQAERAASEGQRSDFFLTFVVVGGGPTGVEVAGSIAELARRSLAEDFRYIDPRQARVMLIEGGPRVLAAFPEKLSLSAQSRLTEMGVAVCTGARVASIDAAGVSLIHSAGNQLGGNQARPSPERIEARTVIWAAGVAASPLAGRLGSETDRAGRVKVTADLSLPGHPHIFALGDAACFEQDGSPLPGIAPVALQQGEFVAAHIRKLLEREGEAKRHAAKFRYRDKGNLATVGRSFAVADLGQVRLSGRFAWLAWVIVHIYYLIGFHNRLFVLVEWAWAYLTWQRGARLITGRLRDQHSSVSRLQA